MVEAGVRLGGTTLTGAVEPYNRPDDSRQTIARRGYDRFLIVCAFSGLQSPPMQAPFGSGWRFSLSCAGENGDCIIESVLV